MAGTGKLRRALLMVMGTSIFGASSVVNAAFPVEEIHYEGHHGAAHHGTTCQSCVDGLCVPNWQSFGYYPPTWRKWPIGRVTATGASAITDRLPEAILPKKSEEDSFDPALRERRDDTRKSNSSRNDEEASTLDSAPRERESDFLTNPFEDDPLMPTSYQTGGRHSSLPRISLVGRPLLPQHGQTSTRETSTRDTQQLDSRRMIAPPQDLSSQRSQSAESPISFPRAGSQDWEDHDNSNPLRPGRIRIPVRHTTAAAPMLRASDNDVAEQSQFKRNQKVNPLRNR